MLVQPLTTARPNLQAIESSLREVQRKFSAINSSLNAERGGLNDYILANMMAGYANIDRILAAQIDLFENGYSKDILELNNIVLYGTDPQQRLHYLKPVGLNEKRFYQQEGGGIGDLIEAYRMHRGESVWNRAAMVHVRILSQPQLFVEGNHRTGALLMSYILMREGKPPFVLTVDNAKAYFEPSTMIGKSKRHSLLMYYRMLKMKRYFARLLQDQLNPDYLL
jgi:hypothetical protein